VSQAEFDAISKITTESEKGFLVAVKSSNDAPQASEAENKTAFMPPEPSDSRYIEVRNLKLDILLHDQYSSISDILDVGIDLGFTSAEILTKLGEKMGYEIKPIERPDLVAKSWWYVPRNYDKNDGRLYRSLAASVGVSPADQERFIGASEENEKPIPIEGTIFGSSDIKAQLMALGIPESALDN
jgi:hypothetical protein